MKMIKKSLVLCLILLLGNTYSQATTWETVDKGFWADSAVWLNGVVPDTTSGDTFYINHPIVINSNIVFDNDAYVIIDANGGICGHHQATIEDNATLISYGVLELDSLLVDKGYVHCYSGKVILTTYGKITGIGARLVVDSAASLAVGPWFDCVLPTYAFLLVGNETLEKIANPLDFSIYPNPFSNILTIENQAHQYTRGDGPANVKIYDGMGRMVLETTLSENGRGTVDVAFLKPGIYYLHLYNKEEVYSTTIIKN